MRESPLGGHGGDLRGIEHSLGRSVLSAAGPRRDLRLVPLALVAWVGAWLGTLGGTTCLLSAAGLCAGLVALARLRRSWWVLAAAILAATATAVGGLHAHRLTTGPVAALARAEAVVTVRLELRGDLHRAPANAPGPGYATAHVLIIDILGRGEAWQLRAPALVIIPGAETERWSQLPVGSRLTILARLQPADRGSDLAAVARVRGRPEQIARPSAALRLVERVRTGLRASVANRDAEARGLVPALVLGDTSALTPELTEDFRSTGLMHLTAVSGANLTLLLAFVLFAARWLGVRGRWLRLVGLLGVIAFVGLCRTEPSVLRAAAMGLVALVALGSGGRRAGLRNLALAMIILLLVDPFLGRSVGFALSVLASGGIIWWARPWASLLARWLPRIVAESLTVPLAAHLSTLPVVAAISGQVSVAGLAANALAGPFVGPATVLGFLAAGSSLLSAQLADCWGFGAAWSAQLIIWVARAGAQLPGASWPWPASPAALVWLGLGALATALLMPQLLVRRWLCLLVAAVMITALVGPPVRPGWPPRGWVLVACDVGQGDALAVRAGPDAAVVIDAGPDPAAVDRCLDQLRVASVPLLVLSHFHADHVDGLAGVFDRRQIGQIWVSPFASPRHEVAEVVREADRRAIPVSTPPVGTVAATSEAQIEVIGPLPATVGAETESSRQNDSSLVLLVDVAGVRLLLTGDVEPPGQHALLTGGRSLRADVLKLPHHGSARQDPAFFAATGARVAIASAGAGNDYGHPAPRTLRLADSLQMTVLRTDQHGAVAVTVRDGRLAAATQRR